MGLRFLYLHGFGSGPQSVKANFFRQRLNALGHDVVVPDLNVPDFEHLSFEKMVHIVEEIIDGDKKDEWVVAGASLGALVGLRVAEKKNAVKRLLLLAPAIGFSKNIHTSIGKNNVLKWQNEGYIPFDHAGYKKKVKVHYAFLEELNNFDEYSVHCDIPIDIFHGAYDEIIHFEWVEEFVSGRPEVKFHLLESDHGLHNKLDWIWRDLVKSILKENRHEAKKS